MAPFIWLAVGLVSLGEKLFYTKMNSFTSFNEIILLFLEMKRKVGAIYYKNL